MAIIPDELAQRILLALDGDHLADELRRALTPSNGEAVMHVAVPERFAPHFASALSVGAASAMMCSRSQESVDTLRSAASSIRQMTPQCMKYFLHRSDAEKIMDMIVQPGVTIEAVRSAYGWRRHEVIIRAANGAEIRPMPQEDLDEATAKMIVDELRAIAERLGVPLEVPGEPVSSDWEP